MCGLYDSLGISEIHFELELERGRKFTLLYVVMRLSESAYCRILSQRASLKKSIESYFLCLILKDEQDRNTIMDSHFGWARRR